MKKSLQLVMITLAALCLISGCSSAKARNDANAINTSIGSEFTITLDSNPSTGYSWQENIDETMLVLVGKSYEGKGQEGIVGAGGIETFTFKALKKGQTTITLNYRQPWVGGGMGETKTFTVEVK